jgi:hypothetical protein
MLCTSTYKPKIYNIMKTKSISNLKLNKRSISNLRTNDSFKLHGGAATGHACLQNTRWCKFSEKDSCYSPCGGPLGTLGCNGE